MKAPFLAKLKVLHSIIDFHFGLFNHFLFSYIQYRIWELW
ncbi:hypothetical protein VINE108274_00050 [Vibrio neptunius]